MEIDLPLEGCNSFCVYKLQIKWHVPSETVAFLWTVCHSISWGLHCRSMAVTYSGDPCSVSYWSLKADQDVNYFCWWNLKAADIITTQRGAHSSHVVCVHVCSFLDTRVLDESPCRDVGSVTPYSRFIWEFLLVWLPEYSLRGSCWERVPGNASYSHLKKHSAVGSNCSNVISIFRNLYLMSASSLWILLHHCSWDWKNPSALWSLLEVQILAYSWSN